MLIKIGNHKIILKGLFMFCEELKPMRVFSFLFSFCGKKVIIVLNGY